MTILLYNIPVATLHARFIIIIIIDVTPVYIERMLLYDTSGIYLQYRNVYTIYRI